MASSENVGGANAASPTDYANMTHEELVALLQRKQRLDGITIATETGITKAKNGKPGRPFKVLKVKGGAVGSWGINLKPAAWQALLNIQDEIWDEFKKNWSDDPFFTDAGE